MVVAIAATAFGLASAAPPANGVTYTCFSPQTSGPCTSYAYVAGGFGSFKPYRVQNVVKFGSNPGACGLPGQGDSVSDTRKNVNNVIVTPNDSHFLPPGGTIFVHQSTTAYNLSNRVGAGTPMCITSASGL